MAYDIASARRGSGRRSRLLLLLCAAAIAWASGASRADTVVLTDGTIVEGKIVRETNKYVKIETASGARSISRKKIDRIVRESMEGTALQDIRMTRDFGELKDISRVLKNAQALYDLERFDEIPDRVKGFIGKGTKLDDLRIRWMLIETYERQGKWDEVETMLKQTLEDGGEEDKIRAKAHLDIFEQNPNHTLRKIGDRRATEFLSREMRNRGKNAGALQSRDLMEAALIEYTEQILTHEKVSTRAFEEDLDVTETLAAIQEAMEKGSRNIVRELPYLDELQKVEGSLYRAGAVLPGYTDGYKIELVRVEAEHLYEVIMPLLNIVSEADPERMGVSADENGRLTKEGREQWRAACERFLEVSAPVVQLVEYMLRRVRQYPVEMRRFIRTWEDVLAWIEEMRQNAVRRQDRTML